MSKNKKQLLIIIIILLIISIALAIGYIYFRKNNNKELDTNVVEVVDSIDGYEYKLEDRDTEKYKEEFFTLKEILEKEELNYEEYASSITKLFLMDLYTIDNKISKYDVGGLDYIYPEQQEKFKNKLINTMYKLVEDNSTNNRNQELPIVENVNIEKIEDTIYKKGETNFNAYKVKANITYKKDLGYDEVLSITLVKDNEKIYIVNLAAEEKEK